MRTAAIPCGRPIQRLVSYLPENHSLNVAANNEKDILRAIPSLVKRARVLQRKRINVFRPANRPLSSRMVWQESLVEVAGEAAEGLSTNALVMLLPDDPALPFRILGRNDEVVEPRCIKSKQPFKIGPRSLRTRRQPMDKNGGAIVGPAIGIAIGEHSHRDIAVFGVSTHEDQMLEVVRQPAASIRLVGATRLDDHLEMKGRSLPVADQKEPIPELLDSLPRGVRSINHRSRGEHDAAHRR